MTERKDLAEFIAYQSNNSRPLKQFPARMTFAEDQPLFTYSLPLGDVVLYPEFLVFLTLTGDKPGMHYFVRSYFQELAAQFKTVSKLHEWVNEPARFFKGVALHLVNGYKDQDRLAKAMSCPNSIFLPLSEIRGATACRSLRQGNYIKVASTRGPLVICQDAAVGNVFSNLWSYLSGNWHADVVAALQAAGRRPGGQ